MITYQDLLKNRRSIRDYEDKKIDAKILQEILADTCQAPSAMGLEPWEFIVIQDQNLMKRISNESKISILHEIESTPNSKLKEYEQTLRGDFNIFYNAPCLVLITGKKDDKFFEYDCALAAAYLMFAATARNLGTCWIGFCGDITNIDLRKEIELPDDYHIAASLIIGYPQNIPEYSARQPKILKMIT